MASTTALLVIDMQNDFILPGSPMRVAGGEAIVPNVIRAVSVARDRGLLVIWFESCRCVNANLAFSSRLSFSAFRCQKPSILVGRVSRFVCGRNHPCLITKVHMREPTSLPSFQIVVGLFLHGRENSTSKCRCVLRLQLLLVPKVFNQCNACTNKLQVVREHDPLGRDVELFRRHLYARGDGPTAKGSKGAELVDGLALKEGEYKLVKTRFSAFFDTHLSSFLQINGIKSLVVTGVQTPNCIRQTVFDAVASNYQPVTVLVDATAAETPEVHAANIFDMKNIGVKTVSLEEWCCADA